MANQTINTQDSVTGSLLKAGKASKGDAKTGVFAKLIASFQKHIKQSEAHSQVDGKKTSVTGKLALNSLQTGVPKLNPESVGEISKVKASLKVSQADKASESAKAQAVKGVQVKGEATLSAQSLLQDSKAQALAAKSSEKQDVSNMEKLVIDNTNKSDTEKLQKHAAIGLGAFQQELRDPTSKLVGNSESKEEILTGIAGKNNKNTGNTGKSPLLVMSNQGSVEQKDMLVGKNKAEKIAGEAAVIESKTVDVASAKKVPQGSFSLKDMTVIDNATEASKLTKRDEVMSVKGQAKGENISAKSALLASAGNSNDSAKLASQEEGDARQGLNTNLLQGKEVKGSHIEQELASEEKVSKIKSDLKSGAANRSGIAGVQAQASISTVASVRSDASIKLSAGQDSSMAGDDRGMGRPAAELLMADGTVRDARSTRSDFAMQMAYRSAASFKPSDAMLEISKAAKDGTVKLELMLEPATLGKIQVSLQTDAQKQMQVHVVVDQQASRQVLEQQLPQLRQALADQGLNLAGFTMDMNSQQQNDGKGSGHVADMGHINSHGEPESVMSQTSSLRMGVNIADDGSLSILA